MGLQNCRRSDEVVLADGSGSRPSTLAALLFLESSTCGEGLTNPPMLARSVPQYVISRSVGRLCLNSHTVRCSGASCMNPAGVWRWSMAVCVSVKLSGFHVSNPHELAGPRGIASSPVEICLLVDGSREESSQLCQCISNHQGSSALCSPSVGCRLLLT